MPAPSRQPFFDAGYAEMREAEAGGRRSGRTMIGRCIPKHDAALAGGFLEQGIIFRGATNSRKHAGRHRRDEDETVRRHGYPSPGEAPHIVRRTAGSFF